jgi:hypothetical protein
MFAIIFTFLLAHTTVTSQSSPALSAFIKANSSGYKGIVTNVNKIQYTSTNFYISTSGVGSYVTGPWVSPNVPIDQNFILQFPFSPTVTSGTKTLAGAGLVGLYKNGVPIYIFGDGMSWNNLGIWNRNAYFWEVSSFDSCYGHADVMGIYHHHVNPICLYNYTDSTKHSPIIGYVIDGYPIYGPFGYTNANSNSSAIKRMVPSYPARNITTRTTLPDGTVLTTAQNGPPVNSAYPIGAYAEDYVYTAGYGDLDKCNGRWTQTPEYPDGTYAYFIATDSNNQPVYPFSFLCYYGDPVNVGRNLGKATVPTTATTYYSYSDSINLVVNKINIFLCMGNFILAVYLKF